MSFNEEISKLSEEIAELKQLADLAKLSTVKTFLNTEINRLKIRKASIEKELENSQKLANQANNLSLGNNKQLGINLVSNYMWDQTNDYVKIYIEVDKNQKIEDNELSLKFASSRNFTCVFGKFRFTLGRLYKELNTEKSTVKVTKSNRVIITLYKSVAENWPSLQVSESAFKNSLEDDKDLMSDPNAGMMKLMKDMYDSGDDEMKRTIAKSWYESQNKKGLDPEFPQL